MVVRGYQIGCDWSRQDHYTGVLEDATHYVEKAPDIVVSWGRSDAQATQDSTAGKLTFNLINQSRQFSPENTASPIYGKVLPGTPVRFQATNPIGDGITTLFKGPIDTLDVDPNAVGKDVSVSCLDGWGTPGDTLLTTQVWQGLKTGLLIHKILDLIGWPLANRSINEGYTYIPYWWLDGVDAATAVNDLVHSEGPPAIAYVQAGVFYFRDRLHRLTSPKSVSTQATFTHIQPAGSGPGGDFKILKGSFNYNHGLNRIVNSAEIDVVQRLPRDRQVVWSADDPITLNANEVQTFTVSSGDPFIDLQAPDPNATVNSDVEYPGDYMLTSGSVSFSFDRLSGASVTLTITAGGGGAYLSDGIRVRGTPLTVGQTRKYSVTDQGSVNTFGSNSWDGNAPWAYFYDADAITRKIVAVYGQARPSVTFDIADVNNAHLGRILVTEISDRITIRNDEMGLNSDFMVEQITHTVQQLGIVHRMTLGCQVVDPVQPTNAFIFDTATPLVNGFNNGRFGVDGISDGSALFMFDTATPLVNGFDNGKLAS